MTHYFNIEDINWYTLDIGQIVQTYAVTIFAYVSHLNIFMIKVELKRPIERRIKKIFKIAIFNEFLMY